MNDSDVLASALVAMEPETVPCIHCNGRGWIVSPLRERDGREYSVTYDCVFCGGLGRTLRDGTAIVRRSRKKGAR